jgi:hypothetical protein
LHEILGSIAGSAHSPKKSIKKNVASENREDPAGGLEGLRPGFLRNGVVWWR